MTLNERGQKALPFTIGVLAGSAVGAGLALLFAPRLRRELRERAEYSARSIRKTARAFRDEVCDAVARGAGAVEQRAMEAKRH